MGVERHMTLRRELEAAKRGLEAEYRRKAKVLDDALRILEEVGPILQSADVARFVPAEKEAPVSDTAAEEETGFDEGSQSEEQEPNVEQETESEEVAGTPQGRMWEDTPSSNGDQKPFKLISEIRKTISEFRGHTFTQKDITSRIIAEHPEETVHPGSVSHALKRLSKRGEIKVVKVAHGGADPNLYREVSLSL